MTEILRFQAELTDGVQVRGVIGLAEDLNWQAHVVRVIVTDPTSAGAPHQPTEYRLELGVVADRFCSVRGAKAKAVEAARRHPSVIELLNPE